MQIELFYFEGCPNADAVISRLRELLAETGIDEPVHLRRVESVQDAERTRFLGSPTVRVDGRDIDPDAAGREDFGLKCRIYRTTAGMGGTPPDDWVRRALHAAIRDTPSDD